MPTGINRLSLLTGELQPEQILNIEGHHGPKRDIALWSRQDMAERPDFNQVQALLQSFISHLDQTLATFELSL